MPWQPLPRIAFAIAIHPFQATATSDLPLELGDELYIIEEGGRDGQWLRGYLVAPPSLLAGLTTSQGQTLEARVFSGIFPKSCVHIREVLGDDDTLSTKDHAALHPILTNGDAIRHGSTSSFSSSWKNTRGKNDGTRRITNSLENTTRRHKRTRQTTRLSKPMERISRHSKPQAPVPMLKIGDETPTSESEPLIDEIASCLREWHATNLHELLLTRQYALLDSMSVLMKDLNNARRQLLHSVLTSHELHQLRQKTVWNLVRGNKLLNRGVVVRDPAENGRLLSNDDSAITLTQLQSVMSLLDDDLEAQTDITTLAHLLLQVKALTTVSTEPISLSFRLVTRSDGHVSELSETYTVDAPSNSSLPGSIKSSHKALFTELGTNGFGTSPSSETETFLVVTLQQAQTVQSDIQSRTASSRYDTGPQSDAKSISTMPDRTSHSTTSKSTRRSMMWTKSVHSSRSKHPPLSKATFSGNPVVDRKSKDGRTSRDGRPSTVGSMVMNGRPESAVRDFKVSRTIAVGVIKLNNLMDLNTAIDQTIELWTPLVQFDESKSQNEIVQNFDIIKYTMPSLSGYYERSKTAERLQVSIHTFMSNDVQELVKSTPTLLSNAILTNRLGFEGAPNRTRSDIYVTLKSALLSKHTLLSRHAGPALPIPANFTGSNLQITIEVRRASGDRIENAIYGSSSDETGVSSWESTATQFSGSWNQTLRLAIPMEAVQTAHLVMVLSDIPQGTFAIGHLPLWHEYAFVRDGCHSLLLYKYDDFTSMTLPDATGKGGYLSLPWKSRAKDSHFGVSPVSNPLASLHLQTYLCSTQLSQNKVLISLLRWRGLSVGDIPNLLQQLNFVPEIEIVKLLPDVLDALFGILVEYAGNDELEDLVFVGIVNTLGIVHDRRFNLIPLVDTYTESTFDFPFATPCLVRSLSRLLTDPAHPDTCRNLRAAFKVMKHILKFIDRARQQQKIKEAGIGITGASPGFSRSLWSVLRGLEGLMKNTTSSLVGSQTLAVQHFHTWLPELTNLLPQDEVLQVALKFMEACSNVQGKLILYKLILIINYAKLDIFLNVNNRAILTSHTVRWIAPYWGKLSIVDSLARDQVRLCCSVVLSQADSLNKHAPKHIPNIVASYLSIRANPKKEHTRLSLLFPTTYPFPTRLTDGSQAFDESLIELAALLSTLSAMPSGLQLDLKSLDIATLLSDVMYMQFSVLEREAFPADWLSVYLYHHRSILRILRYVAGILIELFLPSPDDENMDYDTELWKIFFTVLLRLIGSDALALETFPEQRRRAAWKIAGDIREEGATLLKDTWEAIGWETTREDERRYGIQRMGGYQVQYVPGLVGSIVELCLSVHEGMRRVAVEILHTMIVSEWTMNEDLSIIQTEMIDSLEGLFKEQTPPDIALRKLFIEELMTLFAPLETRPQDPLSQALKAFIDVIDEFIELLAAVHSKALVGEASHLVHRLRLMNFLRDMQKEEIFIRYVHQLTKLQVKTRNFTQAGLSLLLHADLYDWDPNRSLAALHDPVFPPQTHFERKEQLYFEVIKHFEDGQSWSNALDAYKCLQEQYERNVFDFNKVAGTERAIANIYETIAKAEKIYPKYFKVSYRGMGFPPHMRDKQFIFEGLPHERTTAFTDRMQAQHPNASITTNVDVGDFEGQYLHIAAVNIHRNLEHPVYQRSRVPPYVREYLAAAGPDHFSTSIDRNITGPVEEHWVEKTIYTIESSFPTILRRAEIVDIQNVRLTPLQTALERVLRKTQEMMIVEQKVQSGDDDHVPLLIDALRISVSASADSSIVRYRDLLPSKRQTLEDAGRDELSILRDQDFSMSPLENALKMALIDHAVMIKSCLAMFGNSVNSQARHSHDDLSQNFEANFAPELSVLSDPNAATIPPLQISHTRNFSTPRSPGRVNPQLTASGTIPTVSTSVLDTPSRRSAPRSSRLTRLSFLSVTRRMRNESDPFSTSPGPPVSYKPTTVNGLHEETCNGHRSSLRHPVTATNHTTTDTHATIEPRRSLLDMMTGNLSKTQYPVSHKTTQPYPHYASQQENIPSEINDPDWVTDRGSEAGGATTSRVYNTLSPGRANSSASVTTSQSFSTNGVGQAVVGKSQGDGVRKRLSLFRLGGGDRKGSKASNGKVPERLIE